MKIISSLKNLDMLNKISSYVDGVVLGCQYSSYCDSSYSVDEINNVYQIASKNNKKVYVLLNFIMHENDIDDVKKFINSINENVYFIFQDLGILNLLIELNRNLI